MTPENTKIAFAKALDLGAHGLEFDVQLTRDDVPVVIHDETLDRTTNGKGAVAETDFDSIRRLDAGSWFSASFHNVEVPTIEEVLATFGGKTLLNMELKPDQRSERLVRHAVTAVARFDLFDSVLFSSFHYEAVQMLRRLVPRARIGILCQPGGWREAMERAHEISAETLHPQVSMVDSTLVAEAHLAGRAVWAWTANQPGEIALLRALGVDGVFSDYPERVVAAG